MQTVYKQPNRDKAYLEMRLYQIKEQFKSYLLIISVLGL